MGWAQRLKRVFGIETARYARWGSAALTLSSHWERVSAKRRTYCLIVIFRKRYWPVISRIAG